MKNIFSILAVCVLLTISSTYAQNITNTLGFGGLFKIKDVSNDYLTINQINGKVNILKMLRLENTTSSTVGVIYKGVDYFIHNFGSSNTFVGVSSGNFSLTGSDNTALGYASLMSNTSGDGNIALGYHALFLNTTGNNNTVVGYSLSSNITGSGNIAIGNSSLENNKAGYNGTAIGYKAMEYSNTTATTYINSNVAVGFEALRGTILGNNTGNSNAAIGYQTLVNNTSGSNNTTAGYSSLYSNSTGNDNTALGYTSLFSNTSGSLNTAVGIYSLYYNTTGSKNTALGRSCLESNTIGTYNTALGYSAGSNITEGSNLTCVGYDAEPLSATSTNQITLGNGSVTSLRCNVTTISSLSDARDKKNINDLNLGIDFLMKIKPRQFNWDKREWYENNISDGSKMKEEPTAGFIAQELDEAQTIENAEWLNLVLKDNPEKWEATPGNLLPIMVKAIQELKAEKDFEIAQLISENEDLKNNNEKLSAEVESLKSMSENLVALERLVNELTSEKYAILVSKK